MRLPIAALLITTLGLSGCGWSDSRLNPTNWFGTSTEISEPAVDTNEEINPLMPASAGRSGIFSRPEDEDTSVPIQSVTELRVEPAASGAIVYASGLAARQGAFEAELRKEPVPEDGDPSVLTLTFRVAYPETATATGSEKSRTVHAAYNLSVDTVREVQVIRVVAQDNARETRRR